MNGIFDRDNEETKKIRSVVGLSQQLEIELEEEEEEEEEEDFEQLFDSHSKELKNKVGLELEETQQRTRGR
ncbi:unnamed protein product [Schistocephalus solidus]|uniref:Protein AATF n=1 Tax=Schistocephalus solidus TaxID=70667 RepID=A0A183TEB0_SCHSO|nr:unnamed protein product [Schistocephalus solidus]